MKRTLVLAVSLASLAGSALAQVEARTATPQEVATMESGRSLSQSDQTMKSPMLLEVPLQTARVPAPLWMARAHSTQWTSTATRRFICDKARVEVVQFTHGKVKPAFVPITVSAFITSEYFRQDLDVTLTLVGLDGKELARRYWHDETVGSTGGAAFGGSSKTLKVEHRVPRAEFDRWMAGEGAPLLRVLVEVQGDEEDN